jgi:hypothetical protein
MRQSAADCERLHGVGDINGDSDRSPPMSDRLGYVPPRLDVEYAEPTGSAYLISAQNRTRDRRLPLEENPLDLPRQDLSGR